jgi:phenylpropionate dioxygenase-like ring-hydroxylating dioxygenase large terminal subunit
MTSKKSLSFVNPSTPFASIGLSLGGDVCYIAPMKIIEQLVSESLTQQRALPSTLYTSDAVFDTEHAHLFRATWQYVGLTSQVQHPGDFFTTRLGHTPVLILRNEQGQLTAFVNVCPHRGSELVLATSGQRKTLQCHYHAWTFSLTGRLKAAPCAKEQACFDASLYSLTPLSIDSLGPLIFVNPTSSTESLFSFLGELPAILQEFRVDLSVLKLRGRQCYEMAANWKLIVENYLECYHCAVAHPRFSQAVDLNQYEVLPYQNFSLQRGPIKAGSRELTATKGLQDSLYFYLFPNLMLNFYPGPGSLSLNLILPIDAHHSKAVYEFLFSDEVPNQETEPLLQLIDEVQKEDIVLCESVHRGMRSGFYQPGPLMLTREKGLAHFHQRYHASLLCAS